MSGSKTQTSSLGRFAAAVVMISYLPMKSRLPP
jgi:hypothetical protein